MEDLFLINDSGEKISLAEFLTKHNIKIPKFDTPKTVGELIKSLSKYPKDMKVELGDSINHYPIRDIVIIETKSEERFLTFR